MSSLKFAYVLAPVLPIQVETQRRGSELPLLVTSPVDSSTIFACSPEAAALGVTPGLSVYQARQMVPQAFLIAPDELAYHASHGALQAALQVFTPLIETVALGEFLVDVRAVTASHGGDEALAAALASAAASASGLSVQVGVGGGRFMAEQAARQAPPGSGLVVPIGAEAAFLASLPVDVLPNLPGEIRRRLYLFDLYTLGDLAALRKPAVLRQFGGEMAGLYELARGRDPRPLNPDVPPLRLVRSLRLPSPASARPPLLNAVQRLCWQVSKVLAHKGYHAEALKLTLYPAQGGPVELGLAANPPTSDETRLSRLAAQLLGRLPVTSPVAAVAVSVYPLRAWHLGAHQIDLLRAGVPEKQLRFENALQLLVHRFGQAVVRVAALLGPPIPLPVTVRLDERGTPISVDIGGLAQQVLSVQERWREEKHWWDAGRAQRRDYYRVALTDDSFRNIFQDLLTEAWYLDRAWPVL
jgi:DNA polymerase-4